MEDANVFHITTKVLKIVAVYYVMNFAKIVSIKDNTNVVLAIRQISIES